MPRQSAAVYRRRRLVVLITALVIVAAVGVGVWLAVAQPWASRADAAAAPTSTPKPSATETATPTPTKTATPTQTPTPDPTPVIVACTASDVLVEAVTDATDYPADKDPKLSIRLKNTSAADCTINVGSTTQKFVVSSGDDVWWRSTDCQKNPSDMIVTLKAGQTVDSAQPVVWDRTRSSVDTCDSKNRPAAPGGGASYHVAVSIGGFDSGQTKQIFLR